MSVKKAGHTMAAGQESRGLTVRGAAFLGIGAMVGAGIFTLLGEAGAVAGSAVWLSFLLGGLVATLMGYTVAKMGTRFPASGGLVTFFVEGYGNGHRSGVASWLMYFSGLIVTAMVAVSFGSYASELIFGDQSQLQVKILAALLVVTLGAVNIIGSDVVNKVQSIIVIVLLVVFTGFIAVTWANMDPDLLQTSTYPDTRYIVSSVGLTFFAYLGFAVISFTAADIPNPERNVARATYMALGITAALYVAISIGTFGTLTVEEVVGYGGTALAEAARPALGEAGFVIMALAALLATSSSVNANVYAAKGVTQKLTDIGQFPPVMGQISPVRGTWGFIMSLAIVIVMASFFDLTAIASIGSAVALLLFLALSIAAYRLRGATQSMSILVILAMLATAGVLVLFAADTLENNPRTFVAMLAITALAVVLEVIMSTQRDRSIASSEGAASGA